MIDLSTMSNKEKTIFLFENSNYAIREWSKFYPRDFSLMFIIPGEPSPTEKRWEARWKHMLNFKNSEGEIVMKEHDNGKLSIYDEVLKESLEHGLSLEEAKKKAEEAAK